jgi:hypothetical protein
MTARDGTITQEYELEDRSRDYKLRAVKPMQRRRRRKAESTVAGIHLRRRKRWTW